MGFGAPQVVDGHPRAGLPFGIFSVLTLRESADMHWANGIEWESLTCAPASAISDPDCTPMDLFFDEFGDTGMADAFDVYGSSKCGTPGGPGYAEAEERATAHLLAREEAQVEANVWAAMAAQAVDLNPAGALTPEKALAALEGWMGRTYGSLGVIHGTRQAASLWSRQVDPSGSRLLTKIGTPVSAGAGYPGTSPVGAAPATGEQWVMASPALFGYRGSTFAAAQLDRAKNDMYAVAQRLYVVGFDPCGVAAVRMTV